MQEGSVGATGLVLPANQRKEIVVVVHSDLLL